MRTATYAFLMTALATSVTALAAPSESARLATSILQGITEESKAPRQPQGKLRKMTVLMQAKRDALSNAPLIGFLNGWQVSNSVDYYGVTGGAMKGDPLIKRRRLEGRILPNGGNSSMFPKYAYLLDGSQIDFQSNYGPIFYELDKSVNPRVTYVRGDSLDSPASSIKPLALQLEKDEKAGGAMYTEAQVWGDLWLKDVKYEYVPNDVMDKQRDQILEQAKHFGMGVKTYDWVNGEPGLEAAKTILEPATNGKRPYLAPTEQILRHASSLRPEARTKWTNILGEVSFNLPEDARAEILSKIPEAKAGYEAAKAEHFQALRGYILDPATPVLGRVEALRQWAKSNPIDFALVEPIQQLIGDPRAPAAAEAAGLDLIPFQKLDPGGARLIPPTNAREILLRAQFGYKIQPAEVAFLQANYQQFPTGPIFDLISQSNPGFLYSDNFLKEAFRVSAGRSDEKWIGTITTWQQPQSKARVAADLESRIVTKLFSAPPGDSQLQALLSAVRGNPSSELSVKMAVSLAQLRPSPEMDKLARDAFLQWAKGNGYELPVSLTDLPYELQSFLDTNLNLSHRANHERLLAKKRFLFGNTDLLSAHPAEMERMEEELKRLKTALTKDERLRCSAKFAGISGAAGNPPRR